MVVITAARVTTHVEYLYIIMLSQACKFLAHKCNNQQLCEIITQDKACTEMSYILLRLDKFPATTALVVSGWLKAKRRCKFNMQQGSATQKYLAIAEKNALTNPFRYSFGFCHACTEYSN